MSQKLRDQQYPLDRPPDGMVVEPQLPTRHPMTPSQTSVNNSLASSDENLPPVTDSQGNPIPLTEFGGMGDSTEESVPTEIRQAAANIPQTGVLFNLAPFEQIAQLHAAGKTDEARKIYNSLNDQAKYVYNNARNMERFTAQEGARLADEFRKMQDERQKLAEDPIKQAQLTEKESKMAAANQIQRDFAVKRQTTLNNINEILKNKDEYAQLVGPWDGSAGAVIDSIGVNEDRQAKRAKLSRLLFQDVLELTKYLRPTTEKDLELAQKNVPGRFQNWPVFEDYLNEKKQMLLSSDRALVDPASNQPLSMQGVAPQQAPSRPSYQVGKSYRDASGRVGVFTGYNPDGSPAFSRPVR